MGFCVFWSLVWVERLDVIMLIGIGILIVFAFGTDGIILEMERMLVLESIVIYSTLLREWSRENGWNLEYA